MTWCGTSACPDTQIVATTVEPCVELDEHKNYIDSVAGLISASEFELQVKFLIELRDGMFENYKEDLKSHEFLKTKSGQENLSDFLDYVCYNRTSKCYDQFYGDVTKLRYSYEINKKTQMFYDKLFRLNKLLLWKVIPYDFNSVKKMPVDVFYENIIDIDDSMSLEQALRKVSLLQYEDNIDLLNRGLKNLLLIYHPDKNKHKNADIIYISVSKIYKVISAVIERYVYHYEDTIFCDIKEFFRWNLGDFETSKIHNYMVSVERPLGEMCKKLLRDYKEKKYDVLKTKDGMLLKCRELVRIKAAQIEQIIECPVFFLKVNSLNEEYVPADITKKEMKSTVNKFTLEKKNLFKELVDIKKHFQVKIKCLWKQFMVVKDEFLREIEKENRLLISVNDIYGHYTKRKRIGKLKLKIKNMEEEINSLWISANKNVKFLYKYGLIGKFKYWHSIFSSVDDNQCHEDKRYHDEFLTHYNQLYIEYKRFNKKLKNSKVLECTSEREGMEIREYIFLKLQRVSPQIGKFVDEYFEVDVKGKFKILFDRRKELQAKFKTEEELEQENEKYLRITKELKKDLERNKKEIEQLRHECEISEAKVRKAKIEVLKAKEEIKRIEEEERRAKLEKRKSKVVAGREVKILDAQCKAYEILVSEMKVQNISLKELKDDIKNLFWQLHTFVVFNKNIADDFKKLKEELENLKCSNQTVLDKLMPINEEYEELCDIFAKHQHEEEEYLNSNSELFNQYDIKYLYSVREKLTEAQKLSVDARENFQNEKL